MPDDGFQLPRSSYDEIKNIIVAYGHLSEPGSLQDVSEYGGMSTTTVSRNNGFLISTGVLEPGQKKELSRSGKRLADAIEHDIPAEIAKRWQEIVAENDFLQKILAAVKIRKGMERSAFESHIAYTAGEKKTGRVMTGASSVVDMLMEAALLKQEDGKLLVQEDAPRPRQPSETEQPSRNQFIGSRKARSETQTVQLRKSVSNTDVNINIDISIECSAEEVQTLGKSLRQLLEDLEGGRKTSTADDDLPEDN